MRFPIPLLIFTIAFLGYFFSNLHPLDWYKHHVFLADAFINGRFDLVEVPEFYNDIISLEGKKFIDFPPMPAILLMLPVAIFGTDISQVRVSMFLGAVNTVLVWFLLGRLGLRDINRFLLMLFFSFGTVHWYASTTGTTWFFAHIVAVFFMLLALLELFGRKRSFLIGFLLGLAFLSRQPTVLGAPFFLLMLADKTRFFAITKQKLVVISLFAAGLLTPVLFQFYYNFARFGDIFESGYTIVYQSYANSGIPYSIYKVLFPDWPVLGQFDVRNIPLHLYTIFLMSPKIFSRFPFFEPSPYGMSLILTSPLFLYAVKAQFSDKTIKVSAITIGLILIPILLHFTQGWVQFGYRFLLDFVPFLLIITLSGLKKNLSLTAKIFIFYSILVNWWGVYWGRKLAW